MTLRRGGVDRIYGILKMKCCEEYSGLLFCKNMKINYSIIIPHRNSPLLLEMCLKSIPQRPDLEVIVVDDNSDIAEKPSTDRNDVRFIFLDAVQSKGAGKARNAGIKESQGDWLLFADADDYFNAGLLAILDEYKNSEHDVVYFDHDYVSGESLLPLKKSKSQQYVANFDGSANGLDKIKYLMHAPWAKMIRAELVEKRNMLYEEVPRGNDTFFSYQLGYYGSRSHVDKRRIYTYVKNSNSITTKRKNIDLYEVMFQNVLKNNKFLSFVGHSKWKFSIARMLFVVLKNAGLRMFLKVAKMLFLKRESLYAKSSAYVDYFVQHENMKK